MTIHSNPTGSKNKSNDTTPISPNIESTSKIFIPIFIDRKKSKTPPINPKINIRKNIRKIIDIRLSRK